MAVAAIQPHSHLDVHHLNLGKFKTDRKKERKKLLLMLLFLYQKTMHLQLEPRETEAECLALSTFLLCQCLIKHY